MFANCVYRLVAVPSELQLPLRHGSGCPGGREVPAEREPGAEQEHVQLPLAGRHRRGRPAGRAHRGHNSQRVGR